MKRTLTERKVLTVMEIAEAVKECATGFGVRALINTYCTKKEISPNGRIIGTLPDGNTILFKKTTIGHEVIETCSIFVGNIPVLNWNKNNTMDDDPVVFLVA